MQGQQNIKKTIMFIIVLGQHVSILIQSSSGPSKKIDPSLKMFKMRCGIPRLGSHSAVAYPGIFFRGGWVG